MSNEHPPAPPPGAPYPGGPPPGQPPQQPYPPGAYQQPYPPGGYQQPYPPGAYPPQQDPKAQRLVNISTAMGWGGLAFFLLLGPIIGAAAGSFPLGGTLSALGLVSAVVGAVIGQIGRSMQGRVI